MIKVGDLTTNFLKTEDIDHGGMPDPGLDNPFDHTYAVLADLSTRLNNLENSIQYKVDTGTVVSQILLTEEAALISADRVAVVGQVTFADFVRDQNGQSTGEVDPKITQIIGDKIRTGSIWSNAYIDSGGTTGMVIDLDNSDFYLGGDTNPTLSFSSNQLDFKGIINILDRGSELGYLATGTAAYVTGVGASGSGIIVGSPGIMGVYNGDIKMGFEAATGNASFLGTVQVGATVEGGVTIGTSTATDIVDDTATALATANQVDTDLNSPSYLSTLLSDSAIAIDANSTSFLKLQSSDTTGVFIGSGGIYGKNSGSTTFSISSLTGDALFAGTVNSLKQVRCVSSVDLLSQDSAGYFVGTSANNNGIYASGIAFGVEADCTNGTGVKGASIYGDGVFGTTISGYGLRASSGPTGKAIYAVGDSLLTGNLDVSGDISADEIIADTKFHKGTGIYEAVGTMKVWQIASGTDANGDWGTYRYTFY